MEFREDIEGLRAVAIVPIVLLHGAFKHVAGGFVGVDVFFVISGFLITRTLITKLDAGHFSLAGFYRRRVARILPTLLVMLAVVFAVGWLILLPVDVTSLAAATAAAAALVANLYFLPTADYFAQNQVQPLLHCWSLGVEEQFYLLYPLIIMAAHRRLRRHLPTLLGGVAILSFCLALWASAAYPQAAFYLLPTRAWELALGGLTAMGALPAIRGRLAAGLATAGLASIGAAVVLLEPGAGFPAPWALVPCAGTVLLIAYGERGPTAALLRLPPVRWIGRISYSTYLWHWPIIALYQIEYGITLDQTEKLGLMLATFAAGALSYSLVEKPARGALDAQPPGRVLALGAVGILLVAGLALAGAGGRAVPAEATRVARYLDYRHMPDRDYQFRVGICFGEEGINFARCVRLANDRPNLLVVGDSHAAQLWRAIAERSPAANVLQATGIGCIPAIGAGGVRLCRDAMARVFGPIAASGKVRKMVIVARWEATDGPAIARTVAALRGEGIEVTVIGPVVEYDGYFPRILGTAIARGDPDHITRLRRRERDSIDAALAPGVIAAGGRYVSMRALECPEGRCRLLTRDGTPVHFDTSHLTLAAAREFAAAMDARDVEVAQ